MAYERDNIRRLQAYVPGEQPVTDRLIKLNTNEHPDPPCSAVFEAMVSLDPKILRRYPCPTALEFRKAAATAHKLDPDQIIATNGGDELLRLTITVFCNPRTPEKNTDNSSQTSESFRGGGGLGVTDPTYSLYEVLANIHDTPVTKIPLNEDWSLAADMATQLNIAGVSLAMVVNPQAPSGHLEPVSSLQKLAENFQGILLIDEAYVDFAKTDALELVRPDSGLDNVLILRTLSKGYSLAGLRFGYGMGHVNLITSLHKARDSYNTDAISQHLATAAIKNRDQVAPTWKQIIAHRQNMAQQLTSRGMEVLPSETNFLLVKIPTGYKHPAPRIYQTLKEQGIFVRYFNQPRLSDCLRITIGTPSQNQTLLTALDKMNDS